MLLLLGRFLFLPYDSALVLVLYIVSTSITCEWRNRSFVVYDLEDRTCLIQITTLRRWTCECVKITNRCVPAVSDGNRTKGLVIQIPRGANTVNPPRVRANPKPQAKGQNVLQ